jgi:hypothetical protein
LLIHRADGPLWPEFAEYDCYACHHSLSQPGWRQQDRQGNRKPGKLPWGSWYFALIRPLTNHQSDSPALRKVLGNLESAMQQPYPDPSQVKKKANAVRSELHKFARQWKADVAGQQIQRYLHSDEALNIDSWDAAEQLYLALYAVRPSPGLNDLTKYRAFAPGYVGPPASFQPRDLLERLRKLNQNDR